MSAKVSVDNTHTRKLVPLGHNNDLISSLADTQDEHLGRLNSWTRYKVIIGLRRYADDICDNVVKELPLTMSVYESRLEEFLTEFPSFAGLYPAYTTVKRHFDCLSDAWLAAGFEVEHAPAAARRQKYVITGEIEDRLREIYTDPAYAKRKSRELPGLNDFATEVGIPKYRLIRHAAKLGLSRVKESRWSKEELALLDDLGHYSPHTIQQKFAEKGFRRTLTGIKLMRKRRRVHKKSGFYSLNSISKLLGIDQHVVAGWVNDNLLEAVFKGTKRGASNSQSGGDTRLIHESKLYRFIVNNPTHIDLRKVDQNFFLYLITKGEIPFAGSGRLTKRMEIGIDPAAGR